VSADPVGTLYLDGATGNVWEQQAGGWVFTGINLKGPIGATGSQGPKGDTGAAGSQGPAGPGVAAGGTAGQVLTKNTATNYDTVWATPVSGGGAYGLTPPATPADGDRWTLPIANGVVWQFRYNASGGTYKWEFVGGSDAYQMVAAAEGTTTQATWLNLNTNGPLVTVPRAGDYLVTYGARGFHSVVGGSFSVGPALGDTSPANCAVGNATGVNYSLMLPMKVLFSGVPASTAIKLRYFMSVAGTATWVDRWISVVPVRVS
jgi:hypothetical protein